MLLLELPLLSIILIGIVIFILFFFGSVTGGIGLILRPFLIMIGIPPQTIIASSTISSIGSRIVILHQFQKHDKINWKLALSFGIPMFMGGLIGSFLTIFLSSEILEKVIGIFVLIIEIIIFLNKNFGLEKKEIKYDKKLIYVLTFPFVVLMGVGVVIVGGLGPLVTLYLIYFFGETFISSSAMLKIIGAFSAITATIIFSFSPFVDWFLVIYMSIISMIGGYFGTNYGIKKGEKWVKNILLIIIFLIGIKLLFF